MNHTDGRSNGRTAPVGQVLDAIVRNLPIGLIIYHLEEIAEPCSLRLRVANPVASQLTDSASDDPLRNPNASMEGVSRKAAPQFLNKTAAPCSAGSRRRWGCRLRNWR